MVDHKQDVTLYHITHGKAGSQWIYRILQQCAPEKIVAPGYDPVPQFMATPTLPGKIYPTLYLKRQQFESVKHPANWKRFIVMRDLRDTLVSQYFSYKFSHPLISPLIEDRHKSLNKLESVEKGLIYLIHHVLHYNANIQYSWLDAEIPFIKYEDLLVNDVAILTPLIKDCVTIPENRIKEVIIANRFDAITKGRKRGEENVNVHERKAITGDWQNHFSTRVKSEFKKKFGILITKMGYEKNNNW